MTNQEINQKIAVACGWHQTQATGFAWWSPRDSLGMSELHDNHPDYCNDLNAMYEAEKTLTTNHRFVWCSYLDEVCGNSLAARSATAIQRAEAFLRTLNKWQDSDDLNALAAAKCL